MDLTTGTTKKPFPQRHRASTETSEEEGFRTDGTNGFEDLFIQQSAVHPATTSDYSSGNEESIDVNGCDSNLFEARVHQNATAKNSKFPRRLVHQKSFHPGDILANTVASIDKEPGCVSPVFHMTEPDPSKPPAHRVYKLVLTGGPCGGKTTGQDRLATFFEEAGWKVFTVPEAATVLLGGGVKFAELNPEQSYGFQRDLLATLLQIEQVFFNQAKLYTQRNVLIICDRGAMDPSAYMDAEGWQRVLEDLKLDPFDLRDSRYNQVVHMVTAADGAESYYTVANNTARSEGLKEALQMDRATRSAWVGHPYVDVVDNSDCKRFDDKILKLISIVCDRVGLDYQDRLSKNSHKRKWLVLDFDAKRFTKYEEFDMEHDYLITEKPDIQVRIRKRGQGEHFTYTITTRSYVEPEPVETRMQISRREYERYLGMKDPKHDTVHKKRRCFNYGSQYFHLDIYVDPLPAACNGKPLKILETYTTKPIGSDEPELPDFLKIDREITTDKDFSMYKLSLNKTHPDGGGHLQQQKQQHKTPNGHAVNHVNGIAATTTEKSIRPQA